MEDITLKYFSNKLALWRGYQPKGRHYAVVDGYKAKIGSWYPHVENIDDELTSDVSSHPADT